MKNEQDDSESALKAVSEGDATLLEFSRTSIFGTNKKIRRCLDSSGTDIGGWDRVYERIQFGDNPDYLLYCDDSCVIVTGGLRDEGVTQFIEDLRTAAEIIDQDDAMERAIAEGNDWE